MHWPVSRGAAINSNPTSPALSQGLERVHTMNKYLLLLSCLIAACTPSSMMSPERLATADSKQLCDDYHQVRSPNVRAELERRNAITPDEWMLIDSKKVKLGMSEVAFLCAMGTPTVYGAINRSQGSWGTNVQYVYRFCSTCKAQYYYVRNGKLTSWQD